MATFPADRVVYRSSGGELTIADDDWVLVWADEAATVPAAITVGGEPVAGSRLRTDREGRLPLFDGPDGVDLLWGTLEAHPSHGVFELAARGSGSGGGAVASVNGQTGTVVLDAADVGALPTGDDVGAVVDVSTYDDPVTSDRKMPVAVFPDEAVVYACGITGDDFPRVVLTSRGFLYLGDGTYDPYNDQQAALGSLPGVGLVSGATFRSFGGLYDENGVKVPSAGSVLPVADPADVVIDTTTYDNTVTGSGKLTTVVGAPDTGSVPVLALAFDGDAFPRLLMLQDPRNAFVYAGDGTTDPYGTNLYLGITVDGDRYVWQVGSGVLTERLHLNGAGPSTADHDLVFAAGTGPVLTTPGGFHYRLVVDDDGVLTTVSADPPPAVIVSDAFDRADGAIGNADTGQTWTALGTGLVVVDQAAGTTDTTRTSVIDAGVADCTVSVDATVVSGAPWTLLMRRADVNNFVRVISDGTVSERSGGTFNTLGSLSGGAVVDGDHIAVTLDGTSVRVRRNGTTEFLGTTTVLTGTSHGLSVGDTAPRLDNFAVTVP